MTMLIAGSVQTAPSVSMAGGDNDAAVAVCGSRVVLERSRVARRRVRYRTVGTGACSFTADSYLLVLKILLTYPVGFFPEAFLSGLVADDFSGFPAEMGLETLS